MEAMRGLNPSSTMFQTQATRNLTQVGFGALRSQKEVTQQDETADRREVSDNVQLSMAEETPDADEMTENAAHSGALGEVLDDYEDDDKIGERRFRDDEEDNQIAYMNMGEQLQDIDGDDLKAEDLQRLREMDDDAQAAKRILNDVPARCLGPAQNIIANQIQGSRPAEALVSLTPVEGVNQIEFTAAEGLGVLDIHDSNNGPIVAEMDEEIGAEQKQSLADDYMKNAISSLPDDRKAIVTEMKEAVEAWASASGADPKAAFAEKLRDLAAGWDDESLQAVAQTYVDAGLEMETSAAG
ncbi:hypothetical protein IJT93_08480 [bacterium]|nr:hypothetical protein [bacterium]